MKRISSIGLEDKIVDDVKINNELLSSTFDQIDQASRLVKYDQRRKMSYFEISVDEKQTSNDLHCLVQKYFYMIELYHLILRENSSTTLTESGDDASHNSDVSLKI